MIDAGLWKRRGHYLIILFVSITAVGVFLSFLSNPFRIEFHSTELAFIFFGGLSGIIFSIMWMASIELGISDPKSFPEHIQEASRPDLSLFFVALATMTWQISTCLKNLPFIGVDNPVIGSILSIVNSFFFLAAAIDFDYGPSEPRWRRDGISKLFLSFSTLRLLVVISISLTIVLYIVIPPAFMGNAKVNWIALPDFTLAIPTIVILYPALSDLFEIRAKTHAKILNSNWTKVPLLYATLTITFIVNLQNFIPVLKITTNEEFIIFAYRTSLITLFLSLCFSWVWYRHGIKSTDNEILAAETSHRVKNYVAAISRTLHSHIFQVKKKNDFECTGPVLHELRKVKIRVDSTLAVLRKIDELPTELNPSIAFQSEFQDLMSLFPEMLDYAQHQFKCSMTLPEFEPYEISGANMRQIVTLLTELVLNADEHAYDLNAEKSISIEVSRTKNDILFRIQDFSEKRIDWHLVQKGRRGKGMDLSSLIVKKFEGDIAHISNELGSLVRISIPINNLLTFRK